MNNIIEKLGMNTPDEIQLVRHCYRVFKLAGLKKPKLDDLFQEAKQLKKILDDNNGMLEILIKTTSRASRIVERTGDRLKGHVDYPDMLKAISIIEKVCYPLKWSEIRELSNE